MATIKLLLGIICFAFTFSIALPSSSILKIAPTGYPASPFSQILLRERILAIARKEIGVLESSGNNDGRRVEAYLAATGLQKGHPYCASFISWVYLQAGFTAPRTAWSPSLLPASRQVKEALPADVLGIYFPRLQRIAHVGMVEYLDGDWCMSIEANTNVNGSRDGDGVYRKRRLRKTIYRFANWIDVPKNKAR